MLALAITAVLLGMWIPGSWPFLIVAIGGGIYLRRYDR